MRSSKRLIALVALPTLLASSASWAIAPSAQVKHAKWRVISSDDFLMEGKDPDWRDEGNLDRERFDFRVPKRCKRVQLNLWAETPTESPEETGFSWSKATFTRLGRSAKSTTLQVNASNGYRSKSVIFKQKKATRYQLEVTSEYFNPGPYSTDYWEHDYELWARCK